MSIARLLAYTALPAVTGALLSLGYDDISAVDGARQAILAGLPCAVIIGSSGDIDDTLDWAAKHSYVTPVACAAITAGVYFLGGLGMEYLTKNDLSQGFTSVAGGLEGLLYGMFISTAGNVKKFLDV